MTRPAIVNRLLWCGVLASAAYIAGDLLAAVVHPEYHSFTARAISELVAIGAPSRGVMMAALTVYTLSALAFSLGVWMTAGRRRALRATAASLFILSALNVLAPLFRMPMRGEGSAAVHEIFTAMTVLAIVLAMGASAWALGRRFRVYAIASVAALIIFGALTGLDAAREPTPWMGMTERIGIGAYLLWQAVLAHTLIASPKEESVPCCSPIAAS